MILYTPLEPMDIFEHNQSNYTKQKVIHFDDCSLLVDCLEEGNYRVVQLLSTNPQHFLNESFQPGKML
ncbi:hypothetical protein Pryu01_00185 [Paraliobacillus ryukyuensis]|uniref:YlzJ-like protein n=1 Tax=Paraliobacillus ryukyuensis TaxID=200904 RepID=A0A366EHC9_9BACI|nr:YlzJ-like family protein [Paraliobacillus ryukyuensis]RBP01743.1 YlzJ-like protein [Paraliobacillus ryukyuensis]